MKDTGGPAYPVSDLAKTQCSGMTLRDYFAGQALAGITACSETVGSIESIARESYQFADAMLAERDK